MRNHFAYGCVLAIVLGMMSGCVCKQEDKAAVMSPRCSPAGTTWELQDFPFKMGMAMDEFMAIVGPPSRWEGSGVTYMVYDLPENEELWVGFANTLGWAFVVTKDDAGKKTSQRRVFPEEETEEPDSQPSFE